MTKDELQFLPAALEIQETPPNPLGRSVAWTLMAFFTIAVAWSAIGEVDIVAVAQGKIIPAGHVKVIQPAQTGVIQALNVTEGQLVQEGDLLVALDPTVPRADRDRLARELVEDRLTAARLSTLGDAMDTDTAPALGALPGIADADVARHRRLLEVQLAEYRDRLAAQANAMDTRKAALATAGETAAKLERTLPLITRRANALKALVADKLVPEYDWLEVEQARLETAQDLRIQQARMPELAAALAEETSRYRTIQSEFRRTILTELTETDRRVATLAQELLKAEKSTSLRQLRAPVGGVVAKLAVHTVGGVVTPAQELMVIVPRERTLAVEAWLPNKDIGFVHKGQTAEVKVETFPFTKYGTIDAELADVSEDATIEEQFGLVYAIRVAMKKSNMEVGNRVVNLSPGMAVTVEIKTGKRRLIEYLLAPLLRYAGESARER